MSVVHLGPAVVLETILRAGMPLETNLINAYGPERGYPGVFGISVLFHPGWDVNQLAHAGYFRHGQISYATVAAIQAALAAAGPGYAPLLTHTPTVALPDHHTLGIALAQSPDPRLGPGPGVVPVPLQSLPPRRRRARAQRRLHHYPQSLPTANPNPNPDPGPAGREHTSRRGAVLS